MAIYRADPETRVGARRAGRKLCPGHYTDEAESCVSGALIDKRKA